MRAADEIPPHYDLFGEGLTTDEDESAGFVAAVGDAQLLDAGARVADRRDRKIDVLQCDIAGVDEEAVLEPRIDGQVEGGARIEADLRPEQRRVRFHGRRTFAEAAEEDEHLPAVKRHRLGFEVLEFTFGLVASGIGQGQPQLDAVQRRRVVGRDFGVADAGACGHEVDLAG